MGTAAGPAEETIVNTGHGDDTTLADEKDNIL